MIERKWKRMELIRTKRLLLIPLEYSQLKTRLSSPETLEKTLNFKFYDKTIPPPLEEAYQQKISMIEKNKKEFLLLTFWQFVIAETGLVIGEAGFKSLPNQKGEIEIGYGITPAFRGKGYAREGVKALAKWALKKENIQAILATTDRENFPSQRVLKGIGWEKTGEDENSFFWRLEKKNLAGL